MNTKKNRKATKTSASKKSKKETVQQDVVRSEQPSWATGKRESAQIIGFTNVGDFVEGEFVELEKKKGKGKSNIIHLKDFDTHRVKQVWSNHILNRELSDMEAGVKLRIVFVGVRELKGGKTLKLFDIWTDEE